MGAPAPRLAVFDPAVPLEYPVNRVDRGNDKNSRVLPETRADLTGSPLAVRTNGQDSLHDILGGRVSARMWPPRAVLAISYSRRQGSSSRAARR